jgi:sugar diacid utilization regulator
MRRSIESDAQAAALREKKLNEEFVSLKAQLVEKEKERVSTVETLHLMESRSISFEAKLEQKEEDFDKLKKELDAAKKEITYLQKKMAEKDQYFLDKCNRLWELCKDCYDKFGAKLEATHWELGEFDPFFGWLCINMKICLLFCKRLLT